MFAAGYVGQPGRPSVKSRAQLQLSRIRDASKNLFRNLHHPVFAGKDDGGGVERAETLARYRDQLLQVLCELQSELNDNVVDLRRCKTHKDKMESMEKQIAEREGALKDFGMGLKEAETVLAEGLRKSLANEPEGPPRAALEVDEVLRYAHTISYTSGAPENWDPSAPMLGTLPPAPHTSVLAKSRILAATRPSRAVVEEGGAGASKKEKFPDMVVRMWKYPVLKEGAEAEEHGAAGQGGGEDKEGGGKRPAEDGAEGGEERGQKKPFAISALAMCVKDAAALRDKKKEEAAAEGAAEGGLAGLVLPQQPPKWRPGNPIVVAPDRG